MPPKLPRTPAILCPILIPHPASYSRCIEIHWICQFAVRKTRTPQIHAGNGSSGSGEKRRWQCGQKFGPSRFFACFTVAEQCGHE